MDEGKSVVAFPTWLFQNPETEELKQRVDALKQRVDALEKRVTAVEKENVLLLWAIAAATAAAGMYVRR